MERLNIRLGQGMCFTRRSLAMRVRIAEFWRAWMLFTQIVILGEKLPAISDNSASVPEINLHRPAAMLPQRQPIL